VRVAADAALNTFLRYLPILRQNAAPRFMSLRNNLPYKEDGSILLAVSLTTHRHGETK